VTSRRTNEAGASLGARLASGTAWAFAGRLLAAPISIGIAALSSRVLDPGELGTYLLAANIVGIVVALASLGQDLVIVRFAAEEVAASQADRVGPLVRRVACIVAIASGIAALAWFAGGGDVIVRMVEADGLSAAAGLVALWILALAQLHLAAEVFRGMYDIRLATLFAASGQSPGIAAGSILVAGLLVLSQLSPRPGLGAVITVTVLATSVSALAAAWLLARRLGASLLRGGGKSSRDLLSTGVPLWVSKVSLLVLLQADLLILAACRPQAEVAVYGVASRLVVVAGIPLAIANSFLPPMIAELNYAGKTKTLERLLRGSATITALPAALVLMTFIVWGRPLLTLLYGAQYRIAWLVLVILGTGKLINVIMGSCGQALSMTGHERAAMGITVLSGVAAVAAAFALGNAYGAVGVAVAMAGGMVLQNALRLGFARKYLGLWTHASVSPTHVVELFQGLREVGRSAVAGKIGRGGL